MLNTVGSVVIYFLVALVMELVIERKFHIKQKLIRKIGGIWYVSLVFVAIIVAVILIYAAFPAVLENDWVRGTFMGIWIFSVINIKFSERK